MEQQELRPALLELSRKWARMAEGAQEDGENNRPVGVPPEYNFGLSEGLKAAVGDLRDAVGSTRDLATSTDRQDESTQYVLGELGHIRSLAQAILVKLAKNEVDEIEDDAARIIEKVGGIEFELQNG